ncbi:MAG: cyclic nucleotide-binding domain-containing protein [Acidimicrobiia bacterium]
MSKCDADLLARVPLFADLTARELKAVAAVAKHSHYAPGAVIVEEGTPGGRFFVLESGTAKVVQGGRTRAQLTAGSYFGELSVLDGEPRSASVVATSPSDVWSIAEFNFRPLVKQQPALAAKLLAALAGRLRAAERSYVS